MKIEKKHWKIAIGFAIGVSVFAGAGYLVYVKIKKPKKAKNIDMDNNELKTEANDTN